jgi:hypothetical protein
MVCCFFFSPHHYTARVYVRILSYPTNAKCMVRRRGELGLPPSGSQPRCQFHVVVSHACSPTRETNKTTARRGAQWEKNLSISYAGNTTL